MAIERWFPGSPRVRGAALVLRRGSMVVALAAALSASAQQSGAGGAVSAQAAPSQESATEQGVALYKKLHYAEAKAVLQKAVASNPGDAVAQAYLGLVFTDYEHDPVQAVARLEQAVKLAPQNSEYHQWLGSAYGDNAAVASIFKGPHFANLCREQLEKAVELDPKDPEAVNSLFEFYLQAPGFVGGGVDKARAQAANLLKIAPARGLIDQAQIAVHDKDLAGAEALYRKAVVAAPTTGLPYNALGYFLLNKVKRTDEAVAVFRQYVQAVPSDPNAYDSLAEGLMAQGKLDEPAAEYKKALGIDEWFSSSWLGLARCFQSAAQWQQGREACHRYLELMPKGKGAAQAEQLLQDLENKKG